jgi:formylglycine-generating enzyme required for sulfatase activity
VEAAGRIGEEVARRREEEREQERREAEKVRRPAEVAAVVEPKKRAAEEIVHRSTVGTVPTKMTNRVGMEFVWIPPGSFLMGSEKASLMELFMGDTKPVHQVTIGEGFYMGKYQLTQAQWQQVMGNNPSHFKGENLPVETVSWYEAIDFIAKLNAKNDGYTYRLPSEAEWEYAARAGTTGEYAGDLDAMAWYSTVYAGNAGNQTHPVGSKLPNAFGLFDMHGNVWEWCEDWYHNSYSGAPVDGSAWLSGGKQKYRVLRGGSWFHLSNGCRSSYRFRDAPGTRGGTIGLRVVAVGRS